MALKRKRSDSEISRASSLLSSPPSNMISHQFFQSPSSQIQTPSVFSSRTRKRYRDSRPSEEDIHQHTLSLLFSAQQSHLPQFESAYQHSPVASMPQTHSNAQQSSLHAFWRLPSARLNSPSRSTSTPFNPTPTPMTMPPFCSHATNCEDCDAPLPSGDSNAMDIDIMMDIDDIGEGNYACTRCAKPVCSHCAVSNLGRERRCLGCAGRQGRGVGGTEWIGQD